MKIKLNEPKTLEFNVDTKGCSEKDLRGYLRFEFENVEYGFPAIFESGIIRVKVPAFQSLLSNSLTESISNHKEVTVNARLDIVANGEAFVTPWNNEIDIEVPVDIQVKEEKKSVITEKKKVNVNDPALFEAFDDAVKKKSKIKDALEMDIKPEVKVKEPIEKEEIKEEEKECPEGQQWCPVQKKCVPVGSGKKRSKFAESLANI